LCHHHHYLIPEYLYHFIPVVGPNISLSLVPWQLLVQYLHVSICLFCTIHTIRAIQYEVFLCLASFIQYCVYKLHSCILMWISNFIHAQRWIIFQCMDIPLCKSYKLIDVWVCPLFVNPNVLCTFKYMCYTSVCITHVFDCLFGGTMFWTLGFTHVGLALYCLSHASSPFCSGY
jgi:hypothetical protein